MKTIHATLLAHQQQEVTTTCLLVKVECVGAFAGNVYGFTNSDEDRVYNDGSGSLTYESENGFTPARIQQTSGVNVDNSELDGVVSDTGITEAMVRAGLFRSAKVTIYRVNYEDLTTGRHEVVGYGKAGETIYWENGWRTEFRSLSQWLKQPIGAVYSLTCRAQFGDARCGLSFTWTAGTVTSVGSESDRQFTDSGISEADDFYKFGVVEWLTGDNAGHQMEVDASTTGGAFDLSLGLPYPIQVGDTFQVRQDCAKTLAACIAYSNIDNFRGEPFIPVDGTAMVPGAEIKRA